MSNCSDPNKWKWFFLRLVYNGHCKRKCLSSSIQIIMQTRSYKCSLRKLPIFTRMGRISYLNWAKDDLFCFNDVIKRTYCSIVYLFLNWVISILGAMSTVQAREFQYSFDFFYIQSQQAQKYIINTKHFA